MELGLWANCAKIKKCNNEKKNWQLTEFYFDAMIYNHNSFCHLTM